MSTPGPWRDFFVATDEPGRRALAYAASCAVDALGASGDRARSGLSASQLRDLAQSIEICPDEGVDVEEVIAGLGRDVFANSVWPQHHATLAHLHPPTTVVAAVTDLSISATNQSMDSWDQAPMATHVELALMDYVAGRIGFSPRATGVMTSGGTASNLLALTLARASAGHRIGCDVAREGLPDAARQWRFVTSDQAHFSVQRAAAQLGLGREAVVLVATDQHGAMRPAALSETLEQLHRDGLHPIAVVGTAGTTDLGAIDPLAEVARLAHDAGAWFHVDAAVAGAFIMSNQLRERLDGLELADSVTIDFHKLWWQPFNASALIVSDGQRFDLLRVISDYLDRGDELDDMINLVGRSLDTSRRFDAAKVVASLRTIGRTRFAQMLEYLVSLTVQTAQVLNDDPRFSLLSEPSAVTVVFDAPGFTDSDLRRVQQNLLSSGEVILGRTTIHGRAALKFTLMNPLVRLADMSDVIERIGAELTSS